jgi:uncharacterized protein YdaU (DUF1376 family)
MKRHWMPLYIADYLADTAHLTTVEHGAYLLIIMHYWTKGRPPENDDIARRVSRMTNHQWSKSSSVLKSFFLKGWRHERLEAELAQVAERSKAASANARKSHEIRKQSAPLPHDTITLHSQKVRDVGGTRAETRNEVTHSEAAVAISLAFLNAAGFADQSEAPANWYGLTARAALWVESGYPIEMISEETKIVAAQSATPKPVAYFEKVFATAFARRQRPLPVAIIPPPEKAHVRERSPRRGEIHDALDGQIARARAIEQIDDSGGVGAGPNTPRLFPPR